MRTDPSKQAFDALDEKVDKTIFGTWSGSVTISKMATINSGFALITIPLGVTMPDANYKVLANGSVNNTLCLAAPTSRTTASFNCYLFYPSNPSGTLGTKVDWCVHTS